MTRANKTRSALFTSILSLLLCVSMLVGTTFAWFTDTAESGLNEIVAGNLDVALLDKMGESVEGDTELFTMPELWEPGAVAYAQVQVANVGNLDLKASLSINYEDVNSLNGHVLSEVLKYAIIDATDVDLTNRAAVLAAAKASTDKGALSIYDFDIELEPGEKSDLQTLVIYWEPNGDNVDNLYNANNGQTTSDGKPLQINLGVKVFATQLGGKENNENDSFGPGYDLNAPTIITIPGSTTVYSTINEAYAADTSNTTFNVSGPIDVTKMGELFKTAGQNVTFKQIEGAAAAYYDFSSTAINANNANITIEGGYIQGMRSNTGNGFGFTHTNGTVTYKGVTINDSWTNEHTAATTYENCTFTGTYYIWTYAVPTINFTNCVFDREDSRAILVYSHGNNPIVANITGCTFKADAKGYTGAPAWTAAVEVDASHLSAPSAATVNITNCTADANYNGIVRDKAGANAYIYVDGDPIITSQAAFEKAIADGKENIYLAKGNYTMVPVTNRTVNISGTKEAVLNVGNVTCSGATINFKDITINGKIEEAGGWYTNQLAHATKATYENCTINGLITGYVSSDFTNCVFENTFDNQYSIYCYGGSEYNFTGCTFNTECSKAIKVYNEGDANTTMTVNVTDCEFNASKANKAAVEIDSLLGQKFIVNITNCETNEFYTKLWADDGTSSKVTVDGNEFNSAPPTVETIKTAEELKEILNSGTDAGSGNYVVNIEADIDLTGETWTPVTVDGYNGADVITINGNNHTITGLSAPLFKGGFAGGSGIIINDLTIQESDIVSTNTLGSGAFIETIDSMAVITLKNCNLKNSTISGSRTGGLIGWNSGYNNTGDGAVKTYVTIENCSVTDCEITGVGTVGGIIGHAGANPWTYNTIKNCTVANTKLTSNDDSYRVGAIVGTANVGEVTITGCTSVGNTFLQNNNGTEITRPEGQSELYGRTSLGETGKLTIDGVAIN